MGQSLLVFYFNGINLLSFLYNKIQVSIQPNAITAKRTALPNLNVMALHDIQKVIVEAAAQKKYIFAMAYVAIL
jgi:hypothetical protein